MGDLFALKFNGKLPNIDLLIQKSSPNPFLKLGRKGVWAKCRGQRAQSSARDNGIHS